MGGAGAERREGKGKSKGEENRGRMTGEVDRGEVVVALPRDSKLWECA